MDFEFDEYRVKWKHPHTKYWRTRSFDSYEKAIRCYNLYLEMGCTVKFLLICHGIMEDQK